MILGSVPITIVRKLGWDKVKVFYEDVLFRNRYFGIATVLSAVGLALFTVTYPGRANRETKRKLWAGTCLAAGSLLAPLVCIPRDLVTMSGGYMLSLTIPVALSCSLAPNYVFLNMFSVLATTLSVAFAHQYGIPFVIARNHAIANTTPFLPTSTIASMLLGIIATIAGVTIIHMNFFVGKVEEAVAKKEEKKEEHSMVDFSDDITNGILMSGYALYIFLQILWEAIKITKKLLLAPKNKRNN